MDAVFVELLSRQQTMLIVSSVFFGSLLWDTIISFPAECKYIYWPEFKALVRGRGLPSLPSLLLLFPRLVAIPLVALCYSAYLSRSQHCVALWHALLALYVLSTLNAGAIFFVRCAAIRNSGWKMMSFVLTLLASQAVVWSYWMSRTIITQLPDAGPHIGTCTDIQLPAWSYLVYLSFGVFEFVTLILTIQNQHNELSIEHFKMTWKIWRQTDMTLTQRYYQDTILHHTQCLLFIIGEVIWCHKVAHDTLFNVLTSPLHIYLCTSLAPKTLRNIRLFHAKRDRKYRLLHKSPAHTSKQRFPEISGRSASGKEISMSGIEVEVSIQVTQTSSPPDNYTSEYEAKRAFSRLSATQNQPLTPSTDVSFSDKFFNGVSVDSREDSDDQSTEPYEILKSSINKSVDNIMTKQMSKEEIKKSHRKST